MAACGERSFGTLGTVLWFGLTNIGDAQTPSLLAAVAPIGLVTGTAAGAIVGAYCGRLMRHHPEELMEAQ